jgi:replicative DNA helicase
MDSATLNPRTRAIASGMGEMTKNREGSLRLNTDTPKMYPTNLAAERVVLGAVIEDDGLLPEIIGTGVCAEDFSLSDHQAVFRAILALRAKSCPVDYVSVVEELGNRDQDYVLLSRMVQGVVLDESHAIYHAQLVRKKARQRALLKLGEWLLNTVTDATDPDVVVDQISRRAEECRT